MSVSLGSSAVEYKAVVIGQVAVVAGAAATLVALPLVIVGAAPMIADAALSVGTIWRLTRPR